MNQDINRRMDIYVSVVVLVRDHEGRIGPFVSLAVAELVRHYGNYELIMVEDGSQDASRKECLSALEAYDGVRLIEFARNYGDEAAYRAGLDNAIGDIVVTLSLDHDSPLAISPLVNTCMSGSGVVAGVSPPRQPGFFRGVLSRAYRSYLWSNLRTNLIPGSSYCWAFSRTSVNALLTQTSVPQWLRFNASQLGLPVQSVDLSAFPAGRCRVRSLFNDVLAGLSVVFAHSRSLSRVVFASAAVGCTSLLLRLAIWPDLTFGLHQLGIWCAFILILLTLGLWLLGEFLARNLQGLSRGIPYVIVNEYSSNSMLRNLERRNVTKEL